MKWGVHGGFAWALVVFLLWVPGAAGAGVGPTESPVSGYGGVPVPAPGAPLVVREGRVGIDFTRPSGLPIRSVFRLHNDSTEDGAFAITFPYWGHPLWGWEPPGAHVAVTLDGVPLPIEEGRISLQGDGAIPAGTGMLRDLRLRLPNVAEPLDRAGPGPYEDLPQALRFVVALAAGGEGTLEVSYQGQPGVSHHELPLTSDLVQVDYVLRTSQRWRAFHSLAVEVLVPAGAPVASTLPLARGGGSDGGDVYAYRTSGPVDANLRVATKTPLPPDRALFRVVGLGNEATGRVVAAVLPVVTAFGLAVLGIRLRARRRRRSPS